MSSIKYILGPEEDEQDLVSGYYSQDHDSHTSSHPHSTTTLAYRQRPSAGTSASNSPGSHAGSHTGSVSASASASVSAFGSRNDDYTSYDNTAPNYTMDPHSAYEANQAHGYNYPASQNFHATTHAGSRSSRASASGRDGYYAVDHNAVAGFDTSAMTPMMNQGAAVFSPHYETTTYGAAGSMDPNMNGVMHQHAHQHTHQHAHQHHQHMHQPGEYSGEYVNEMGSYGDYQEETEVTPRTGRPSRAKKGKPVHNCPTCGRVFTRAEHLRRHQLSHEPFKYFCDYPECKKSFSRPDLLSRHQQKHTSASDSQAQSQAGRVVKEENGRDEYSSYLDSRQSSSRESRDGGNGSGGSVPRTHQDYGIAPGHHLNINIGYDQRDAYQYNSHTEPGLSYMQASTTSVLPRSVSGAGDAHYYQHSQPSPSTAWSPASTDRSVIDSTLSASVTPFFRSRGEPYMAYSVPTEGASAMSSCVTPLSASASAASATSAASYHTVAWSPKSPHGFVAASHDLNMQRMSSGSSSGGWTPQSSLSGNSSS